ncbi:unnamed protein product [Amoebophrya sp. A25]|nr:unnamed protein product [Amoebophrya sp. A25]|eukprot:GSA25T00025288001.1
MFGGSSGYQKVAGTGPGGEVLPGGVGPPAPPILVVPSRPKEKVEALLHLLVLVAAAVTVILPIFCIVNYPAGFLLEPVMTLEKVYLIVFGGIMFLIEVNHGGNDTISEAKRVLFMAAKLLDRLMGKGFFVIFVGCNCFNMVNPYTQSALLQTLVYASAFFVCGVGGVHLAAGGQRALALNSIRRKLQVWEHQGKRIMPETEDPLKTGQLLHRLTQRESLDRFLDQFAIMYRDQQALTKEEFQDLCRMVKKEPRFGYNDWDMEMIFETLSREAPSLEQQAATVVGRLPKEYLGYEDIYEWLCPGMPVLL